MQTSEAEQAATASARAVERAPENLGTGSVALSVCCMTAGPGPRVAALLELFRPVAGEILVAVDDRAGADVLAALERVADRLLVYPYADPVDRPLAWLHAECRGRWVLLLDDDEIPSGPLLRGLPALVAANDVTHYWLPRRWVFPDATRYLDEPPWRPDYQLRLVRDDPRFVRFSDEFHRPIVARGAGRFLEEPLWHVDCVLRSEAVRREKARKYERSRPGMRIAGRAYNFAVYVPELRPDAVTSPVPEEERRTIARVLAGDVAAGDGSAHLARVGRVEIDRLWPGRPLAAEAYRARLEPLEPARPLVVGEQRTIDVRVHNLGPELWDWGRDAEPSIRVGTRWRDARGEAVAAEELRSHFPAPLPPGESDLVPVHVRAPGQPGRYRLEVDLVHEHVRWFDCAVGYDVEVRPRRRIAIVGDEPSVERSLELLGLLPELEPLLLSPGEELPIERHGYARAPGLRSYLLFGAADAGRAVVAATLAARTAALLRAARARRDGRAAAPLPNGAQTFLEQVSQCELLLVAGNDAEPGSAVSRELWRLAATVLAADALGVPVASHRGVFGGARRRVDDALVRLARARVAASFDDALDLAPRLAQPLNRARA